MRVATWNTEWADATSARGSRVRTILEALGAEILVITEGSVDLLPQAGETVDAGNQWGYTTKPDRRKVMAWTRTSWRDVATITSGAGLGRVVHGVTETSLGPVRVIAVCIPWRDCHVRTGRRDASPWSEHIECCDQIRSLLDSFKDALPTIVMGDFNQRVPRHGQPLHVAAALDHALTDLTIHTGGETSAGKLIDHIATSDQLKCSAIHPWPATNERGRLSDHAGVAADLTRLG